MVFHDRFNHASLIDAVLATRCKHKRYPHLSVPTLKSGMKVNSNLFVITESVFSMDGDTISTKALSEFCVEQKATLYIDDAHGFGVTGKGRGIAPALLKLVRPSSNLVAMLTLGKALGASGGVVLGSKQIIEYLTQFSRPFIYDTAPPPVIAAAALEALSILREDSKLLEVLEDNVRFFRDLAKECQIPVTTSDTPIQPIKIGDSSKALNIAKKLKTAGIYVRAIRPPTVPMGTARLRVTISSQHTKNQISRLVDNLSREISSYDGT